MTHLYTAVDVTFPGVVDEPAAETLESGFRAYQGHWGIKRAYLIEESPSKIRTFVCVGEAETQELLDLTVRNVVLKTLVGAGYMEEDVTLRLHRLPAPPETE